MSAQSPRSVRLSTPACCVVSNVRQPGSRMGAGAAGVFATLEALTLAVARKLPPGEAPLSDRAQDEKVREGIPVQRQQSTETPRVAVVILNWNGWRDTIECLGTRNRLVLKGMFLPWYLRTMFLTWFLSSHVIH